MFQVSGEEHKWILAVLRWLNSYYLSFGRYENDINGLLSTILIEFTKYLVIPNGVDGFVGTYIVSFESICVYYEGDT